MNKILIYRTVLGLTILLGALLLLTGHPLLVAKTPYVSTLPLGNLITWLSFISISLLTLSFIPSPSSFRYPAIFALVLAILWMPGSAFITGNLQNIFTPSALISSKTWYILSSFSVILSLITLVAYLIQKAIQSK